MSGGELLLLAVRDPDVLHFRRMPQELAAFHLTRIEPVAAARRRPGALHVRRGRELDRFHTRGGTEVPHAVHVVMLGEHFRQLVFCPGDHVDDAVRYVGRLEDGVELGCGDRIGLRGDDDHGVTDRDRRRHQGDEAKQGEIVRGGDAEDADGFVHREGDATNRRVVDGAVPFVRPRGVGEESRDTRVDFLAADSRGELGGPRRQILGNEIEDLGAGMTAALPPSLRGMRGLDGIPYVLAIALRDFAEHSAIWADDLAGVALVGSDLFTADEELVGPINWGKGDEGRVASTTGTVFAVAVATPSPFPHPPSHSGFKYSYIPSLPPSLPKPDSR